jgi:c-di-GMP-binding flagellar brake protein YcgR
MVGKLVAVERSGVVLRSRVGERVLLELVTTGESHLGEIKSLNDHLAVITLAPSREGAYPARGSQVRITFVRKDGLYEEEGTVSDLVQDPDPQLHVEVAGEAIRTQRRDFVRRDASLNAEVEAGGRRMKCVTKDVSGGGISVLFSELPPILDGTEFDVALNVPDGQVPIKAKCLTKFVREALRGSRWLAGSQFISIADGDRQRIVRFVFRLELAQKRR